MWLRRHGRETEDSVVLTSMRLLRGDAVGLFTELGQGVPAWARVNALAHLTVRELARTKAAHRLASGGHAWNAMLAHLAGELLRAGHRSLEEVDFLQRAALVPLELALLGGELPEPVTPGQLGVLVMSALHHAQIEAHIRDTQNEG